MEKEIELKPYFMGGTGCFQPEPFVTVTFFAANKQGSETNTYPYFEDEDIERARLKAEKIIKSQLEYDKIKKENRILKKQNESLSWDVNVLAVDNNDLEKNNALLIEALENVINSWNKRMGGDVEELKTTNINGDIIEFWSPIASLIDSEPIHKAKELLNNLKK